MIAKTLKTYWPYLAAALVYGCMLLAIVGLRLQLDAARAKLDAAQLQNTVLSRQIENQNAGIRALVEAAEQNREVYLAGLKAAEKKAVRLTLDADELLALPAPTNPDEACSAATGVLRKVTQ